MATEERDRIGWLLGQYQAECTDNSELYRRASLMLTASVIVGSVLVALWRTSDLEGQVATNFSMVVIVVAILAVVALVASIGFLFLAILPGDWDYPDLELIAEDKDSKIIEHLVEQIVCLRAANSRRFSRLQWSTISLFISLVFIAIEAAMLSLVVLNGQGPSLPGASS